VPGNLQSPFPAFRAIASAALLAFWLPNLAHAQTSDEVANWQSVLAKNALSSIVSVLPQLGGNHTNYAEPEGTGVAVDGFILTADHVLGKANRVLVRDHLGNVLEARIFLRDKETDLALLEVDKDYEPIAISDTGRDFTTGRDVCVLGNAFGLGITLTCGIVSATDQRGVGFNYIEDFVQTDAAVNPGMSGAPLLDKKNELVGLVTAIFTKQSDGNLGVNFAASARLVSAFLQDAKDGRLDRYKAGMVLQKVPLPGETGRAGGLVKAVATNSVEEKAGVKEGDLVFAANDLVVTGQADYLAALVLAGDKGQVSLLILRDGSEQTLQYQFEK